MVLCIDGYEFCFGAQITGVYAYIGQPGLEIGGGWNIGGIARDERILDYVSLDGTTTNITQQLDTDKGGASSTQTMKIRVVDFEGQVTRLISPGFDVDDILYRDCTVYLGFREGAFPDDYVDLFVGKIQLIESGAGFVEFTIAHPEDLKRSEVFPKIETEVAVAVDYKSVTIQSLFYQQRGDVTGTVEIRYLNSPFIGDTAVVSTSGNLITVEIESGVTKHRTIKKAIEGSLDASQLVTVKGAGDVAAAATSVGITPLEVDGVITLESVDGFLVSNSPLVRTFCKIDDEIIEYTAANPGTNQLTGCTRATLNSFGSTHEIGAQASSFYVIGDGTGDSNAIDLALRIMLSGGGNYISEQNGVQFFSWDGVTTHPQGLLVTGLDLVRDRNIREGDTIIVSGSLIPGNNITGEIIGIEVEDLGTVIYVDGASFALEIDSPATISVFSQYDVLPDGIGMSPKQVDIDRFLEIKRKFPSSLPTFQIYLKESMNVKEFIQKELFVPSAMYALPRKGKSSVGILAPPLYESDSKVLTLDNLKDPQKIKTSRSANKYFYNSVVTKYNQDSVDDKYLNQSILLSATSTNRVKAPNRPLVVEAKGVRPGALNEAIIERNAKRYLDRYQFGAEWIPVEPDFKTGFGVEIGDSIVFGEPALQVSDTTGGDRNFRPRVFEVVNKDFDWRAGRVRLQIVDTNYSTGVRYGTWSPASEIVEQISPTQIRVRPSFGSESEADKWAPYTNRTIRIRAKDYSESELVRLVSFDESDPNVVTVSPAMTLNGLPSVLIDSLNTPGVSGRQLSLLGAGLTGYTIGSFYVVATPLQRFTATTNSISSVTLKYDRDPGSIPSTIFYDAAIYKLSGNLLDCMNDAPNPASTNSPVVVSNDIVAASAESGTDKLMTFTFPANSLTVGSDYAICFRIKSDGSFTFQNGIDSRIFLKDIPGRSSEPRILNNYGFYYIGQPFSAVGNYPLLQMKLEQAATFDFSQAIMDVPPYDSLNAGNDSLYKAIHVFWNPSVPVVSGVDVWSFTVSAPDSARFWIGAPVRIHSKDYVLDSKGKLLKVVSIVGTTITLSESVGFVPTSNCIVELIGFASDEGAPYVWV